MLEDPTVEAKRINQSRQTLTSIANLLSREIEGAKENYKSSRIIIIRLDDSFSLRFLERPL